MRRTMTLTDSWWATSLTDRGTSWQKEIRNLDGKLAPRYLTLDKERLLAQITVESLKEKEVDGREFIEAVENKDDQKLREWGTRTHTSILVR
jgi:hypothetical protein